MMRVGGMIRTEFKRPALAPSAPAIYNHVPKLITEQHFLLENSFFPHTHKHTYAPSFRAFLRSWHPEITQIKTNHETATHLADFRLRHQDLHAFATLFGTDA